MYYSYTYSPKRKTYHFAIISFLFATFFLYIFGAHVFAEVEFGPTAEEYRSLAYKAQQDGDYDRALTFYKKVLAIGKEDPWILNNLGVIYEQLGVLDQAELYYLKALELDSNYLPPYSNLAFLYKEQGDLPRAISYFRTRIEFAPENDEWVPVLIEELNAIDPGYKKEVVETELKQAGQRLSEVAQEKLSLNVARANGHYRKAEELAAQHQFEEALHEINNAMALTPKNSKLKKLYDKIVYDQNIFKVKDKMRRAEEFLDSGDVNSARKEFQTILAILPSESVQE